MSGAAAVAGGAAAAQAAKVMQEEEEEMTTYSNNDVDYWEFKIVRTFFGTFKNPDKVKEVVNEQATYGWSLVEKFDDQRIRFKRPLSERKNDDKRGGDPYKTYYGMSQGWGIALVLTITFSIAIFIIWIIMLGEFLSRL